MHTLSGSEGSLLKCFPIVSHTVAMQSVNSEGIEPCETLKQTGKGRHLQLTWLTTEAAFDCASSVSMHFFTNISRSKEVLQESNFCR